MCVIGLGRVGLPTAAVIAAAGHRVVGVEVSATRRNAIRRGASDRDEPGLSELVKELLEGDALTVSERVERARVYVIATPSTGDPHAAPPGLEDVLTQLTTLLEPGALIALETTCAPGTTHDALVAPLEAAGWREGEDVFVAHCPERVLPGDALRELRQNARVIGADTAASREAAAAFYATFTEGPITATTLRVAEATKLIENVYRDVNIALANELADLGEALGLDMNEAIGLANTHPRVDLHRPGVGVGGACLPLATTLLAELSANPEGVLATARRLNAVTPTRLARRIAAMCQGRSGHVALLGATYKASVASAESSPSQALLQALEHEGVEVRVHDPMLTRWAVAPLVPLEVALDGAAAVVVVVPHDAYTTLDPERVLQGTQSPLIVDLCDALEVSSWSRRGMTLWKRGVGDAARPNLPTEERSS